MFELHAEPGMYFGNYIYSTRAELINQNAPYPGDN